MKDHIRQFSLLITLAMTLAFAAQGSAEVYKTVDKDGNVVYTDRPPDPESKPMDLPGLSVIAPQAPTNPRPAVAVSGADTAGAVEQQEVTSMSDLKKGYRDFTLVSPTPDQTFVGTENKAVIAWDTRYALQPGMSVTIYIDGVAREPTTSALLNVVKMDRGAHEVYAELRDARNRRVATTGKVTFHIQQNSIRFRRRAPGA